MSQSEYTRKINMSADEMIFQMLSRKKYTVGYIAYIADSDCDHVRRIADGRAEEIEKNHAHWVESNAIAQRVTCGVIVDDPPLGMMLKKAHFDMWGGRRMYRKTPRLESDR